MEEKRIKGVKVAEAGHVKETLSALLILFQEGDKNSFAP